LVGNPLNQYLRRRHSAYRRVVADPAIPATLIPIQNPEAVVAPMSSRRISAE
jgi:hypothetical protein